MKFSEGKQEEDDGAKRDRRSNPSETQWDEMEEVLQVRRQEIIHSR